MNRKVLIVLNSFLAVTAIGGGIGLLGGFGAPPREIVRNSPFPDYIIPGLALLLIVVGSTVFAFVAIVRQLQVMRRLSFLSGVIILIFVTVKIYSIG